MSERYGIGPTGWEGDLFRMFAENVKDYAVFLLNGEGRIQAWTPGAERLLGYCEQEILGQSAAVFYTPEDLQRGVPQLELEQAKSTGRGEDDRWHIRKDGSRFWASGVMTPLRDDAGRIWGFAKLMRDRSEWQRTEHARQESEASKAAVLETALDGIITIDHEDRIIEFNPAAERMFGFRRSDVLGQKMGELIVPLRFRTQHYRGMAHYLATGEGPVLGKRVELSALRADGTEFPAELAIVRVPAEDATRFTGYIRDVSDRKTQERHSSTQLAVTQVLAEASTVADAAPRILQTVCERLDWDVGGFWLVDRQTQVLHCLHVWHQPTVQIDEFQDACREQSLSWGAGLPGRVYSSGQPLWLSDITTDENFPRLAHAAQAGLLSAFATPLILGDEVLGVVEFLSRSVKEPAPDLLVMMATVGGHIGQFLQRKQAEDALRESEERFRGIVNHSVAGVVEVDLAGRFLFANHRYCEIVGRASDELLSLSVQDISHQDDLSANLAQLEQIGRDGNPYIIEKRYLRPDGTEVWVNNSVSSLRGQEGQVKSVVAVCVDTTDRRRAEEARREGEGRLRTLTDNMPDGAVYQSVQSREDESIRFTFLSAGVEQIFGITADEGVADSRLIYEAIHEDDRGRVLEEEARALKTQKQFDSQFRIRQRSGQLRWLHCRSAPNRLSSGDIVWEGIMLDVTARKESEQTLREQEDRLRLALEAGRMGTWNWNARTGEVQWSPQLEAIHGRSPGTFPGTFEAYQQDMHPEDREQVLASIEQALRTGKEHHVEYRIVLPDGSIHWVEARGTAFRDEFGKPMHMIGVCVETTERKRMEQDLRFLADASRSLATLVDYQSTLQRIAGLAVPHFADWCTVYLQDEPDKLRQLAVAHVDPAKIQFAEEVRERWPPGPRTPGGVYQVFRTGEPMLIEEVSDDILREASQDDEHFELLRTLGMKSCMCVPLSVRGDTIGVISFIAAESGRRYTTADLALAEDLARRAAVACENAQLYATLREEARKKDDFLAMLAHELRNPLAPIRSGLDVLSLMGSDSDVIGMMQQQTDQLVRLVDDLLDVSRIMRGKVELRRKSLELSSIFARAVDAVRPLVEQRGQHLSEALPPEPIWLFADPVRLAQVVGNLLNNASKYTEAGGQIWLSAERQNEYVLIRVRDKGIGIGPKLLPQVFDLFTQDERAIDRSQGGLGIGLTVVKNLVEMHGGRVTVSSEGLSRGSEFVVRLPTIPLPLQQSASAQEAIPTPPLRILVVDDNVPAAKMLSLLLSRLGSHQVFMAHDGMAALAVAQEQQPDIILLDIGLPKLDGFEVARQLRQHPEFHQIPLVAITGYGTRQDRQRTLEAGFDAHLVKPPSVEAIQTLLANVNPRQR